MKNPLTLLALLLFSFVAQAQCPKFSFIVGGGLWQGYFKEHYTNDYKKKQPHAGFSLGCQFDLVPKLAFAPEIGLEYYQLDYAYSSTKDTRHLYAGLDLFYTRLSPGMVINPYAGLRIRLALNVLISSGAIGSYQIFTFYGGYVLTGNYVDRFYRIRNVGNIGPELNIGYDFTFQNGARLGPRISGFVAPQPVMMPNFDTPHNPIIHQLSLEITYTFPKKSDD